MTPHPHRLPRPNGFTLIELLVVVAVIAILAALSMGAIARAMESANTASCKSNIGQIGKAIMVYVKDNDLFLPAVGPPPRYQYWYHEAVLAKYTRDAEVFMCPSKRSAAVGYGLNHRFHCGALPVGLYEEAPALYNNHLLVTIAKKPSGTILGCDAGYIEANRNDHPKTWEEATRTLSGGWVQFPMINAPIGEPTFPYWQNMGHARPAPRHRGAKTNCLFFDYHAETIATLELINDNHGEPDCLYDNQ